MTRIFACRLGRLLTSRLAVALAALVATPVIADQAPDTIVVFDGSGSMWGQLDGRAKIDIARETLSSVLSETTSDMRIGMIAYGHREKGVCADIETVVQVGPAASAVPAMLEAARAISPKGKTPLTDAVRLAAEELRYTENAATVVLVTDGIETCEADPCALAAELERSGVGFTAHVVGFGLSAEEGRQVACLAEETGGRYIQASDAGTLGDALRATIAAPEPKLEPEPETANVRLVLRDVVGGPMLTARQVDVSGPEGPLRTHFEGTAQTASARLDPGVHELTVTRHGEGGYTVPVAIEVGLGAQVIERVLGGTLTTDVWLNDGLRYDYGDRPTGAVRGEAWLYQNVFPILPDGALGDRTLSANTADLDGAALPPGRYLWRGTIDRTSTVERIVEVASGTPTQIRIVMDVWPVHLDARDAAGAPVMRQTSYPYDGVPGEVDYWRRGHGGAHGDGATEPWWMGRGTWGFSTGQEGGGAQRSHLAVSVPGGGEVRRVAVAGERPTEAQAAVLRARAGTQCLGYEGAGHSACVIERPTEAAMRGEGTGVLRAGEVAALPEGEEAPGIETEPEGGAFAGLWSTVHGPVVLEQDGPFVFGDYVRTGGVIAAREEGDVLRGIWVYPSGRWGGIEWRIADGGIKGGWKEAGLVSADRGNWDGVRGDASAPALELWPAFDPAWWETVNAAARAEIEAWAGGPLFAAAAPAPAPAPASGTDGAYGLPGSGERLAILAPADGGVTLLLGPGWCGNAACVGLSGRIDPAILGALTSGAELRVADDWEEIFVTANPGGETGVILVEEPGRGRSARLVRLASE